MLFLEKSIYHSLVNLFCCLFQLSSLYIIHCWFCFCLFQLYSIYIMVIIAFSSTGQCIGYSIWLSVACGMEKANPCGSNYDIELGFNIVACMLGITVFVCGISYCSLFYKYRRAFHFRRGCNLKIICFTGVISLYEGRKNLLKITYISSHNLFNILML
jgi:hypothetical protein